MSELEILEVRLSRIATSVLGSVALLFFITGLDIVYFKQVFDVSPTAENKWVYYAFLFVCFGLSSAIIIQMVHYFLFPPLLLRVGPEGITFATGFRYNPFLIPGPYVKSIGRGITVDLTNKVNFFDVVSIQFIDAADIPSWKPTSVGVGYWQYCLNLEWFFRNTSSFKIIEVVNAYLNSGKWGINGHPKSQSQPVRPTSTVKKIPLP